MVHAARAVSWMRSDSGLLVLRFVDFLSPDRVVRILGSYSEVALREEIAECPVGLSEPYTIEFGPRPFYIALGEELVWLGGVQSESVEYGSEARYWFQGDLGPYGFKGYTVEPDNVTSPHWHLEHPEWLFRAGNGNPPILRLGLPTFQDGQRKWELRKSCFIPVGIEHQLVARTADLIVVVMEGPDSLGRKDHHFACTG